MAACGTELRNNASSLLLPASLIKDKKLTISYMQKRAQSLISEELSQAFWMAGSQYAIAKDGSIELDKTSSIREHGYMLHTSDAHESLLREFIEISDEKSALSYLNVNGLPFQPEVTDPPTFTLERLIGSASFIYWLVELTDAVLNDPQKLNQWVHAKKSGDSVEVWLSPNKDLTWHETIYIAHLTPEPDFYLTDTSFASHLLGRFESAKELGEPLLFSPFQFVRLKAALPIVVAQRYLRRSLESLLQYTKVGYQWFNDPNLPPRLELKYNVSCPWEAICYALLKRMMGHSDLQRCKECGRLFTRKRSHNLTCSQSCYMRGFRSEKKRNQASNKRKA